MAEVEPLLTLIGNYAFPIVACVFLWIKMEKDRDQRREEMGRMTEALNNNTLVIQRLADRLEAVQNDR